MKQLFALTLVAILITPWTPAVTAEQGTLIVATRHVPPFSIKQDDGSWQGISIELWRQIADRLDLEYRFREMGLKEMLDAVQRHEVDAAVAALTITSEREQRMDFTHPFLSTGLGIAVPHSAGSGWLAVTQRFFSTRFLKVVTALLGILLLIGILVWFFERRRNAQFGGTPAQGIGSGLWWSAVTMTTVGYGDKSPQTLGGRAVALVWMFASIIIISSFTAAIATALTIGELGGKVQGKDDLARARISSVADSTSAQYLLQAKLSFRTESSLPDALEYLTNGAGDAVVYDAPIMRYQVRYKYAGRLSVLPGSFARQDYGIALPTASPYRETINQALLEELNTQTWEDLMFSYLGNRD